MIFVKDENEISEYDGKDVIIFPLKKDELELLKEDIDAFEKYINLAYEGEDFSSEEMKEPYEMQHKLLCEDEKNWIFHTFWVIVSLSHRAIIGSICFKSVPDESSSVEIGYGINEKYWKNGYTTSAVKLILDWAFRNNIKKIKAETLKDNMASIRVLEKNDFVLIGENQELLFWEKEGR